MTTSVAKSKRKFYLNGTIIQMVAGDSMPEISRDMVLFYASQGFSTIGFKVKGKRIYVDKPKPEAILQLPKLEQDVVTLPVTQPITKLVDDCPRSPLCEGRNYGVGFAFCKRNGDTVTTVGPISPCKDYLNDQVYSEHTGNPYRAWGYLANKHDIFTDGFAYLAVGIMDRKGGSKYDDQQAETDYMNEKFKNVESFMQQIDKLLNLKLTQIFKVANNRFVFQLDDFWAKYTYLISMYSLHVRIAVEALYESGDALEELKNCKTGDCGYANISFSKIQYMLKHGAPVQDFTQPASWHNEGLSSFKFPTT